MITREFERKYNEMKLSYKNLVNANVDLVDENKILKQEIERLNNRIGHALGYIEGANKVDFIYVCKILKGVDKE